MIENLALGMILTSMVLILARGVRIGKTEVFS